jgi:hypothetical protein
MQTGHSHCGILIVVYCHFCHLLIIWALILCPNFHLTQPISYILMILLIEFVIFQKPPHQLTVPILHAYQGFPICGMTCGKGIWLFCYTFGIAHIEGTTCTAT